MLMKFQNISFVTQITHNDIIHKKIIQVFDYFRVSLYVERYENYGCK